MLHKYFYFKSSIIIKFRSIVPHNGFALNDFNYISKFDSIRFK